MLFVLAGLVLLCVARPVTAQGGASVTIAPEQDLSFGLLLPGLVSKVAVTDPQRRAQFSLSGGGTWHVRFVLPTELESVNGSVIPLEFGPADAGLFPPGSTQIELFDPQVGRSVSLSAGANRTVRVVLGGGADVAADQRAGDYTATVVLVAVKSDT
jgi:hypothetical protein